MDERLGGYVRLSIPERREAVAELTAEGMSTRGIADILGVGQSTVDRDVDAIDPDGSDEEEEVAEEAESDDAGDPDGSDEEDQHKDDTAQEAESEDEGVANATDEEDQHRDERDARIVALRLEGKTQRADRLRG